MRMMDVIKCDIAILSESPFRCNHSVGINIKIFWILIFWFVGYYIPYFQLLWWRQVNEYSELYESYAAIIIIVVKFLGLILYKFILYGFLIFLYNNIEFILVISFYNSFILLLYDKLFSNMHLYIWGIYLTSNFSLFWCFIILYQYIDLQYPCLYYFYLLLVTNYSTSWY